MTERRWPGEVREAAAHALADLSAVKGTPDAVDYEATDTVLKAIASHVVPRADVVALADALRDEERGDPWQALTVARLRALAGDQS